MAALPLHAQDDVTLDELYGELDSLFANEEIPDDLFTLVDSLLALDSAKYSSLNFKLGYVSNIVSSGRNFGFDQYGFSPGISYFHHSGIYGSVTGYWSNEYEPQYYLNTVGIGYMKNFGKYWMASLAHNFYIFNDSIDDHSFNKNVQFSGYYQRKWGDAGIDYSYLYGNEQAHRISLNINGRLKIKPKNSFVDAITILPGASFQWGNANVFYLRQPRTAYTDLYNIVESNNYPRLTLRNYRTLVYLLENDRAGAAAIYLRDNGYTNQQIRETIASYYDGSITTENTFGFMNYSFSLPVSITKDRWNLLMNYTYNIPVALPGEDYEYEANGYFSATLSYMLYWKR